MPINRVLEPEIMDSPLDAEDYDRMDHAAVNRVFVDDLLAALGECGVRNAECGMEAGDSVTPHSEFRTPHLLDVLDLGTGTALIPVELCRRCSARVSDPAEPADRRSPINVRVMAVDAATSMLDLARYNVEAAGLIEPVQLAHVDAKRLPYPDGMFDVVMSNSILHHIPEPLTVLREAVRVTKPGGLVFLRDLLRPESLEQLNHLVVTYAADCNEHQRKLFADSLHAALSLPEIRDLISQLGFPADSVQQTTDRHWTWTANRPEASARERISSADGL
ncbi:MAG TPA: methyltransferase domain-containing protein [Pirellulaceae bacterium]|nr:methyltransferase domain-containing protein [Pirellulaceae bacterium]